MVVKRLLAVILMGVTGWVTSADVMAASNRPDGYNVLCQQGETCTLATPSLVAFGAKELFVYKVQSGSFICDLATFGRDPSPLTPKACSIPTLKQHKHKSSGGSSSSSSSSGFALVNKSLTSGRYVIISHLSGKALEINADGAQIVQNQYSGGANQLWDVVQLANGYYAVKSVLNGKSLGIADWSTSEGAKVSPVPWVDTLNQHWTIASLGSGSFSIVSRFSGKSLDVVELSTNNQAPVRLWTYWGGDNQQWQFATPKPTPGKR